jgi:hypothetical protein
VLANGSLRLLFTCVTSHSNVTRLNQTIIYFYMLVATAYEELRPAAAAQHVVLDSSLTAPNRELSSCYCLQLGVMLKLSKFCGGHLQDLHDACNILVPPKCRPISCCIPYAP